MQSLDQNGQVAVLSVLSEGGSQQSFATSVRSFTGRCLSILSFATVAAGQPVTVEFADALFLGEVISRTKRNQMYELNIWVKQALSGLQSLVRLREALVGAEAESRLNSPQSVAQR